MAINYTLTAATAVLTGTANFADTETVVVGGKTYTFQATLTDSDGNVHVGADLAGSISNLVAAINLTNVGESAVGAGTDYAASMTENAEVEATASDSTTITVTAKTPGSVGNLIASTETGANASWDNATLTGGAGHVQGWAESLIDLNQINSEVLFHIYDDLTPQAD